MKQVCQVESVTYSELLKEIDKIVKKNVTEIQFPKKEDDELWTRQQVADYFQVSLTTVHTWLKDGLIKSYKIGNKTRYKKSEIIATPRPQK